jgi:tetratricopeptide (TPR) repeat protein
MRPVAAPTHGPSRGRATVKLAKVGGELGHLGRAPTPPISAGTRRPAASTADASPDDALAPGSPANGAEGAEGAEGAAGIEARLLAESLRSLRKDHAFERALALVTEHDRRFPDGPLRRQAAMVRAEALLRLGRQSAALSVLESLPLEAGAADRGLSLARAELRAAHARCAEAIPDFDRVLAVELDDAAAERALYGRALCRARAAQFGDARADLRAYLERFPRTDRRPEAERTLRALESGSGQE